MRKLYWIVILLIIIISLPLLFFFHVSTTKAAGESLQLVTPTSCPSSGCAAGQRLNFEVEFSVSPKISNINTQICIYTPAKSASSNRPWANDQSASISEVGLLSGVSYQTGQYSNLCVENNDGDEGWLLGGYAQLPSGTNDRLGFVLNINPEADYDGYVRVKVFELSQAHGQWNATANFQMTIPTAMRSQLMYVAKDEAACGSFKPCYVNSGDDQQDGVGTGLRDAVMAAQATNEIRILKDYHVKSKTVLIDKPLTISGHENAQISFIGTTCDNSMLLVTKGGTLTGLTINDGNCNNPSRDLIEVNSDADFRIENNSLMFGKRGVFIRPNTANVTVAYNLISNHDSYAVYRETSSNSGQVNIFANNLLDNRSGYQVQVDCNNQGTANHNYWGENKLAATNATNCIVNNGKRLGAPILLAANTAGVQAQSLTVTSQFSYAFDGKIGAKRSSGSNFDIIIVNHGQGLITNIPFYSHGAGNINPCSNFYDIFLAEEASAYDLTLSFKYNQDSDCIAKIESSDHCGGSDSKKYPLWWFDPATNATDGWTRTGQKPQGPGAAGSEGQETTCHKNTKEIRVVIDNTGRPNISMDLGFTPFVVGLPFINGVTLKQFTGNFDGSNVNLNWVTSSEINVKGFHILRSDQIDGTYGRVSNLINSLGDQYIGGIYQFLDTNVTNGKTYYYKLEVIGKDDKPITTHGPVSVMTVLVTPTGTITHTMTPNWTGTPTLIYNPTRTNTPYFYKSPTPYFRPATSTPNYIPTRIRTFGPTPTGARTRITEATSTPYDGYPIPGTNYPTVWYTQPIDNGYPVDGWAPTDNEAYPNFETPAPGQVERTFTPDNITGTVSTPEVEKEQEAQTLTIRWIFIIIGIAVGLSVIGITSIILVGTRLS